jgi:hypothetical protein
MRKRYRTLAAFHVGMAGFYVAMIGAWHADWTRLGVAIWIAAALAVALAGLIVFVRLTLPLLAGIPGTRPWRLRHQFQRRQAGSADRPPPRRIAEQFELETPPFGMVAGMSDQPGSQPGLGATDGESERPQPPVDGLHRRPLLGQRIDWQ